MPRRKRKQPHREEDAGCDDRGKRPRVDAPAQKRSHREIYERHGREYDALVARQDRRRNIPRALRALGCFGDVDVVELGCGSGRLTAMLAPHTKSVRGYDASAHMVGLAQARLAAEGLKNVVVAVGDNEDLSFLESGCCDVVVAGWCLSYIKAEHWGDAPLWRRLAGEAIGHARRALRPGGRMVILETLGTGRGVPTRGGSHFYAMLVEELGFEWAWMRTDYRFESLEEAHSLALFFFGPKIADMVKNAPLCSSHAPPAVCEETDAAGAKHTAIVAGARPYGPSVDDDGSVDVPECTAVFWWTKPAEYTAVNAR